MDRLLSAIPPLVMATAGVGLAWLWFNVGWWLPILVAASIGSVGFLFDRCGRRQFPKRPVAAVYLMEWGILAPGAVASLAAALVIVAAVVGTPKENWSDENKELVVAIVAALGSFLTTALISAAIEADDNWIARRIKDAFQTSYGRPLAPEDSDPCRVYFEPDSDGERWVFSDAFKGITGWGHAARLARARGVKEALR